MNKQTDKWTLKMTLYIHTVQWVSCKSHVTEGRAVLISHGTTWLWPCPRSTARGYCLLLFPPQCFHPLYVCGPVTNFIGTYRTTVLMFPASSYPLTDAQNGIRKYRLWLGIFLLNNWVKVTGFCSIFYWHIPLPSAQHAIGVSWIKNPTK